VTLFPYGTRHRKDMIKSRGIGFFHLGELLRRDGLKVMSRNVLLIDSPGLYVQEEEDKEALGWKIWSFGDPLYHWLRHDRHE
jgi:hypothetical protein